VRRGAGVHVEREIGARRDSTGDRRQLAADIEAAMSALGR